MAKNNKKETQNVDSDDDFDMDEEPTTGKTRGDPFVQLED